MVNVGLFFHLFHFLFNHLLTVVLQFVGENKCLQEMEHQTDSPEDGHPIEPPFAFTAHHFCNKIDDKQHYVDADEAVEVLVEAYFFIRSLFRSSIQIIIRHSITYNSLKDLTKSSCCIIITLLAILFNPNFSLCI